MTSMNGRIELSASKSKVLAFVTDPDQFSTCLPNVQEFEKKTPQEFTAKFKVELPTDMRKGLLANLANVGIKMNFQISTEGDSVAVHGEGRSMGMKVSIDLKMVVSEAAGKTGIDWNADVNAGMIMKLMGEDNFKKVADEIINQLVSAVKAKLETA
ncbi:MAG: CoxG family protein [Thermoprotei archaeon]